MLHVPGAEHSASKGSARAFDQNHIIHEVWSICFKHKIALWIERVASKFNISDSPSRGEHLILKELGANWVEPVWGVLDMPTCI